MASLCSSPAFHRDSSDGQIKSVCRQAGRHWKDKSHIKLVRHWYVLYQTVRNVREGGTQTPKHILRATRLEEDPGVSHSESHLLTLGVARTQSSVACWQQPHEYDLAGERWEELRGAWQEDRRKEWDRSVEETIIGRGFGEILGTGVEDFFCVCVFPSSPMWKWHSARRKTGSRQDRETETQTDVLSATRSERSEKQRDR